MNTGSDRKRRSKGCRTVGPWADRAPACKQSLTKRKRVWSFIFTRQDGLRMRVEGPDWWTVALKQQRAVALQQLAHRPRGAVYRRQAADAGRIVPACQARGMCLGRVCG